ncbi:MAG TPA: hypothetical protein V6C52_03285 [Coleofasciculaceae cyanobacterium]|jgi:hypothetical protein
MQIGTRPVTLKFSATRSIHPNVLRYEGPEEVKNVDAAFRKFDKEIQDLKVKNLEYKRVAKYAGISISLPSGIEVKNVYRNVNGWKFWQVEPLESLIARAIEKAKEVEEVMGLLTGQESDGSTP